MTAIEGRCSCGASSYTAHGDPLFMFLCHCMRCQKSSGGPATAGMIYVSFINVSYTFWNSEAFAHHTDNAMMSSMYSGYQDAINIDSSLYAWAVRDGDVSAVPVPAAAWLFGSALLTLAGIKRKK